MRATHTCPTARLTGILSTLGAAGASLAIAGVSHAGPTFTVKPLLLTNVDSLRGIGLVKSIDAVSVNDSGEWLVEVDTDFADTDADGAVVGPGGVVAREGDPLDGTGGTLDSFDSVHLSNNGSVGWNLFIGDVAGSLDSGLFLGTTLIFQEGTISAAPEFSAGTPYVGFFDVRMTSSNALFVIASVDDPAIATSVDRALVWVDYDSDGDSYTETVLAKEGDVLPGVADAATDFGTGNENYAINENGQALFTVALAGAAATNGALYLDDTLLLRKGDASPVKGLTYSNLGTSSRVDLNDSGDWVVGTGLSGDTATNQIIVKNGAKVAQKGDAAPETGGRLITTFNSAPVTVDGGGNVFWYATLDGDAATNQGLWRGDELLVQKGVATAEGLTFTSLAGTTATGGITEGFATSRNGKYVIFRGVLSTGSVGAFLLTFDTDLRGDVNGDGFVDGEDLAIVLGAWGPCFACEADITGDGEVDGEDLAIVLGGWS